MTPTDKRITAACPECGNASPNEFIACEGACTEERAQNIDNCITGTQHLMSCNCCDACRIKCHESWMEENKTTEK